MTKEASSNLSKEDGLLLLALLHLKKRWNYSETEVVSSALEQDNKISVATSRYDKKLKRAHHAEKQVIEKFIKEHGQKPDKNATIAVTLSPCVHEPSTSRVGVSCAVRLQELGITKVRIGAWDNRQIKIAELKTFGLEVSITENPILKKLSEDIASYFNVAVYDKRKADFIDFSVLDKFN